MALIDIPLFPLSAVLFPGGLLNLRIFEQRYLDLVRDCSRNGSGFGVCLILGGREVGEPALPAAVGTLARITDFCVLPDGLLGISAEGGERFQAATTRVRDNGLVHGEVRFWTDEPVIQVPPEHGLLATILVDGGGRVLETRELPTSGYSTTLQLEDIDADGQMDVLVLNSAGKKADVIYGPLWEQATNPKP